MAVKVNSENLNPKRTIDLLLMARIASDTLKSLGKDFCEINLSFVSNQKIRAVNRKYFGIDMSTDVIAFPAGKPFPFKIRDSRKKVFIGDIMISTDKAIENSLKYGTTFNNETALYVVHGILHFMGYNDTSKTMRLRMRKKENELLQKYKKYFQQ